MPTEKSVGCDDPSVPFLAGECGADGSKQGPVAVGDCGSFGWSAEDAELVTQHNDLEVFAVTRTDCEAGQRGDESIQNSVHESSASVNVSPDQHPTTEYSAPTGPTRGAARSRSVDGCVARQPELSMLAEIAGHLGESVSKRLRLRRAEMVEQHPLHILDVARSDGLQPANAFVGE